MNETAQDADRRIDEIQNIRDTQENEPKPPYDPETWVVLEQQLLGCLLLDPERYWSVSGTISAENFYDPVHANIFDRIGKRLNADHAVSPTAVWNDMIDHPGLKELGGGKYLVRMAASAISGFAVKQFADEIVETSKKRTIHENYLRVIALLDEQDGVAKSREALEILLSQLPAERGRENNVSMLSAMTSAITEINEAYSGEVQALSTGIRDLDKKIGGMFPADYVVVAGRPSMGKTSLALFMGHRAAEAGQRVVIASAEMTESALAHRLLAEKSGVKYSEARRGNVSENQFRKIVDGAKAMEALPIQILPSHVRDVPSIMGACKTARQRMDGLDLVIIDYLQLIRAAGRGRVEQMTEVSIQIKAMAKLLNVPVIVVSQLSRGVEARDNKRPMLSDLRETGQIEQDADTVLFCYRDAYYLEREGEPKDPAAAAEWQTALDAAKNQMEIIVAKQRMGGIGTVKCGCHIPTNRFWDLEKQESLDVF